MDISFSSKPSKPSEPKILCVGLCCIDIIQLCKEFVTEDSKVRSIDLQYQRGSNASNSCTVLSQLGQPVELLSVMGNDEFSRILRDDLRKNNIEFSHCPIVDSRCPITTVILSATTASRTTIYHGMGIRSLEPKDFQMLVLKEYSWVHFEGTNVETILSMIQQVKNYNESIARKRKNGELDDFYFPITISVEIENPDIEFLNLLSYVDVAFISKDFAMSQGWNSMAETMKNIVEYSKSGAAIFNAWGDKGAVVLAPDGSIVESPAYPPTKVVDTLGAGDTFNAASLYYLNKTKLAYYREHFTNNEVQKSSVMCNNEFVNREVLQKAVTFGCRIAGAKVGFRGYEELKTVFDNLRISGLD